ncbi:MAG: hypothetical protein ISS59_01740 [Desulfobacteraceae bacterium]|nr:hypothetical protein [Desulfobacteraceae bacterium]
MEVIDRKYKILAVNPCNGRIHTEKDAIVFSAKDHAVIHMLSAYRNECIRLKCDEAHLESISLLRDRVIQYQRTHGDKIPDTDTPCEIDRCIGGKL